tara:strand:+ start:1577 stop:2425 length:849 start_codon:yes stop_codon:yes gene_type:complete
MNIKEKVWTCQLCSKKYLRKCAFDKHSLLCRFESEKQLIDNYKVPNISNEKLYLLLVDLSNKYDKLQNDYSELKKYVTIKKKKIDIIEYLNLNYIEDYNLDFDKFIENICEIIMGIGYYENKSISGDKRDFSNRYLNYVFELNFINGIVKILTEIIYGEREKKNIPIKSFQQKEEIYILTEICNDNDFKEKRWIVIDYENFKKLIITIHKKIINLFTIWQKSVEYKIKDDHFNNIYLENMKKMLGQSKFGCGPHGDSYLTIKHKLHKNISENFKNLISFEIE